MKKTAMMAIVFVMVLVTSAIAGTSVQLMHDFEHDQEQVTLTGQHELPYKFKVFGFVDFTTNPGDLDTVDKEADFTNYFGRMFLTRTLMKNASLMVQTTEGSAIEPIVMPGISLHAKADRGMVMVRLLPCRFDIDSNPGTIQFGTVGLNYQLNLIDKKVFIRGFADYNIMHENKDLPGFLELITENQLGVNISKKTAVFVELRLKMFQDLDDYQGFVIGGEYLFY
jgi:hypothetical protein